MFKRNVESSGKTSIFTFGCRLFYTHIANVLIMLVVAVLVENLSLLKIEAPDSLTSISVTIVCFIFYVVYVYIQSWRVGQRDYNLVLYKHMEYSKWKPLWAALVSQIVGILLVILVQFPTLGFSWVRYARYYYLNFNWLLINLGETFRPIYFLPVLLPLVLAPAAYHMGYRGIYLANKLFYKTPKQEKPDRKV